MKIRHLGGVVVGSLLMVSTVACSQSTSIKGGGQKDQIESVVREFILKNPEVLVQSLQGLQQKQVDEARKSIQKTQELAPKYVNEIFYQDNDPALGSPSDTISIVEFFDYQCTHCINMRPVLEAIIKANPDVRLVFKEFPIRGQASELAGKAGLAAQKQNKYVEFHDALMKMNQIPLSEDTIYKAAESVGIDVAKLKEDMNSSEVVSQLKNNMKLGQDLQLIGTPSFFIAKTTGKGVAPKEIVFIPGQVDQKQLQTVLKKVKEG